MDITVNIKAPAIVEAINKLSEALSTAIKVTDSQAQPVDNTATAQSQTATAPYEVINPAQQPSTPAIANAPQMVAPATQPTIAPAPAPAPSPQTAPATAAPVDVETYRNKVCNAAARLIEQGKMPDVLAMLGSFGVQAVTQLSAEQLPDFANKLVAMGAVI